MKDSSELLRLIEALPAQDFWGTRPYWRLLLEPIELAEKEEKKSGWGEEWVRRYEENSTYPTDLEMPPQYARIGVGIATLAARLKTDDRFEVLLAMARNATQWQEEEDDPDNIEAYAAPTPPARYAWRQLCLQKEDIGSVFDFRLRHRTLGYLMQPICGDDKFTLCMEQHKKPKSLVDWLQRKADIQIL